ncbi:TonB-dependent receptor [Sinomicrobium soli]|uniref:TonB-dependent receptor n=1 Tax=Sinomicrobium sp. N-1-3-6 TaxID=2219864 RepID=UPI000DCC213A|nr:TonB-dependent receptor [Sinomicrobium sp. N-1-3-6]RAV28472.1 SusC/RagA family TonB-linked outer membrane protein [Sinomicrobium sp. N-1-3-6]
MKLSLLLIFISLFGLQARDSYSQNIITLNMKGVKVTQLLDTIESQTDYKFVYKIKDVDLQRIVEIRVDKENIRNVLETIFNDTKTGYEIIGNQIFLTEVRYPPGSGSRSIMGVQSVITVSGTVTDADTGAPVPGANIVEKNTTNGAITDFDGNYTIEVPENAILEASYMGYTTRQIEVNGRERIDIVMKEERSVLEEVVVVGYGTQKRANLTGAVSEVRGDVLENRPVANVGTGIQGLLPGVTITSSSGQPGSPGMNITVRGVNTINSSTSPLILIDGVAGGDLNLLNPDDVESITVLKDAASSAIYGARAANGVILVTTKQGQGKTKFSYSSNFGIQKPTSLPELVNGREYMTLSNEARRARGIAIPYSEEAFANYDSGNFPNDYSNTDWVNLIYKDYATQQSHNFNVNGSTEKTSYFMSYGYLDQTGLIVGDGFKSSRHNVRLRLTTQVTDRLKLDGNISYVDFARRNIGGSGTGGVFRLSQRISPLLPVRWQLENDEGGYTDSPYWSYGSVPNPVRTAYESGYTKVNSRTFNGNFKATLDLFEGMYANARYSYNYYTQDVKSWRPTMPRFLADGTPNPSNENAKNSISQTHRSIVTQTLNTTLNYEKQLGRHDIKFLAGFSQEWAYLPVLSASRRNILLDGVEEIDVGTEDIVNGGTAEHWAIRSYFGRFNYNLDEKYLFEANIRYDGTSRFSKQNRWGVFPSFSAGWNFSREQFMDFSGSVLNLGKLRGSWGELGNQNIGSSYYPYLTEIERQTKAYPIGNRENVGFRQYALANQNIQWETIRMLNFGLDIQMLDYRLSLSLDWFEKNNTNALLKPIYPGIIGKTSSDDLPLENIGSIENKGWEINVGWHDNIGEVEYGISANLSDARNKVTDLGTSAPYLGDRIRREGDPVNAYYGYLTNGLAQVDDFESYNETTGRYENPEFAVISSYADIIQPGDVVYRDISGENGEPDGQIDDYDKVVFGNPYPRYNYSFRGFVNWKNFDFSFFFQGVGKVNGYLADEARHAFINDYSVPKTAHLDRWTPNNPGASYPRMYYQPDHNTVYSDYWLEDASYLRLKNVQFGYTLPSELSGKFFVEHFKIYMSMENVFTITDYFGGFDPEVRETSGDNYPQVKTFSLGVKLLF